MYIPPWPSLNPSTFLRRESERPLPFPLNVSGNQYFYVARNGIYHLFRELGFGNGDTVLVPDYHHGNEIYAIRASGATLRFYPVQRDFNVDLDAIARLCESKPRALYVTHFAGWPQPMAEIRELCRSLGILLIEDCALSFMSHIKGRPLGSFGDYSIFCLYKWLPVPNGGVLVASEGAGQKLDSARLRSCSRMSITSRNLELMLQWFRSRYDSPGRLVFAIKRTVGRALSAASVARTPVGDTGFAVGSTDVGMSSQCHYLLKRFDYGSIRKIRRRNFVYLRDRLQGQGCLVREDLDDGVCPLFLPCLVADKRAAATQLASNGIEAIEFWNHGDPEGTQAGSAAQFLRRHLLEVPIHQDVTSIQIEYIADQMRRLGVRSRSLAA